MNLNVCKLFYFQVKELKQLTVNLIFNEKNCPPPPVLNKYVLIYVLCFPWESLGGASVGWGFPEVVEARTSSGMRPSLLCLLLFRVSKLAKLIGFCLNALPILLLHVLAWFLSFKRACCLEG